MEIGLDEQLDDEVMPRRRRLADAMDGGPESEDDPAASAAEGEGRLAHRISDDPLQGKSGGPGAIAGSIAAGQTTGESAPGYQDPGAGRLADLMSQRKALDEPEAKVPLWKQIAKLVVPFAPVIAAYATGAHGATEGAAQGYEAGVKRRQQQLDLEGQRKNEEKVRLSQEIDQEGRAAEQRQFTHGEDVLRQQTAEHGMDERARAAQVAETGRNTRLADTIGSRESMQQDKFTHDEEMEDQKQQGRMALKRATVEAQAAMQRYKLAHPTETKIPPALAKTFGTYQQSQSRMDVMDKSYKDAIRDPGNSQAMLNLLASHLGMTMGLQPGARMNQAIIQEAMKSGYLDERIEAHFGPDGYLTGVVLTPRQMAQMMSLAQSRLMEDARAVTETEKYFGVSGHAPITPRVPGQTGPGTAGGGGVGGAGATTTQTPAGKTPSTPHKAGEKVTYKGKEYTIKAIRPDGSYELQ